MLKCAQRLVGWLKWARNDQCPIPPYITLFGGNHMANYGSTTHSSESFAPDCTKLPHAGSFFVTVGDTFVATFVVTMIVSCHLINIVSCLKCARARCVYANCRPSQPSQQQA